MTRCCRRGRGESSTSIRTGAWSSSSRRGADQFGGEECVEILLDLVVQRRVTEVQSRSVTVLQNGAPAGVRARVPVGGSLARCAEATLPLRSGMKVYVENAAEAAARLGSVVERPEDADLALVRLMAPFEPRSDLFLESWFHQGALDFPPGLVVRLQRIADGCPLVIDVVLDRPAVLTPLLPVATTVVASYGSSDDALLDALTGVIAPIGRLPFDLPRSMEQVRRHPEDVPGYDDLLFPFGHGLTVGP